MRTSHVTAILFAAVAGMVSADANAAIVIGFNNPAGAENARQVYAYDTTGGSNDLSVTNARLILNIGDTVSINGLGVGDLDGDAANGDEIGVQFIGAASENAYAYNYDGTSTSAGREIYSFGPLPLAGFDIGDALNEGSNRFIFGENVAGNSGDPDGATDFYIRQWDGTSVGDSKQFGFGITLAASGIGIGNVDNTANGNEIVVAFNDRNGDGVLGDVGVFGYRLDPSANVNGLGAILTFDFADRLLSDIAVGDIDPQNNNGNELLVAFNTPEGSELYYYRWNGVDPASGTFLGGFAGDVKIGGLGIGTVVPEPASLALLAMPVALLMRRRAR